MPSLPTRCVLGSLLCHVLGFGILVAVSRTAALREGKPSTESQTLVITVIPADELPVADAHVQPDLPQPSAPVPEPVRVTRNESQALPVPELNVEFLDPFIQPDIAPVESRATTPVESSESANSPLSRPSSQSEKSVDRPALETAFREEAAGATQEPHYSKTPRPRYPRSARRNHEEGIVLLRVHVNALGHPDRVEVMKTSGFRVLDDAARRAVRDWEFSPARIASRAVDSEIEVPIQFKLE